ncbi:MAG: acetyl-CoA carboxylase biotin carboxyl carrier protein [Oscillospiraceae bacterium]|nr:acetyl-CoA carboxylase biotin carboxyl carrier protein [Oscillospiraceae bacterium]
MSEKIYDMVELETIEKLADIVTAKDLGEITIVDGEKTITIKGKKCPPPPPMGAAMPPMGMPMPAMPVPPVQQAAASGSSADSLPSGNVVKAPIVGTFYAASAPDKPPFVTVGKRVKKGDVLMIIESMKLMNEVQSDFDGVVEEILVNNGQAVEFDQPIMIIK